MSQLTWFLIMALLPALPGSPKIGAGAQSLFDQAFQLLEKEQVYDAIVFYDRALAVAPNSQDIWMEYIVCLRKAKYLQRAARAGWRALELGPATCHIWGNLGNVFIDAREWDAATMAFKQAAVYSKDKRWAAQNFLVLGYDQMSKGDSELALKSFQHGLNLDPTHGLAMVDIGVAKATMGRTEEGARDIRRGIEMIEKSGQSSGLQYGRAALAEIEKDGRPRMGDRYGRESFQKLPERFLRRPAPGVALSLQIDPMVERCYQISSQGIVSLTLPEGWKESIEGKNQPEAEANPPAFVYRPEHGEEFLFLFTPHPAAKQPSDLKTLVEGLGQARLPDAVEDELELIPIKSPTAEGYVFTFTDPKLVGKKHRGEDYPFSTQGIFASGGSLNLVTVLSDTVDKGFLEEIFGILRSLAYRGLPEPAAPAGRDGQGKGRR